MNHIHSKPKQGFALVLVILAIFMVGIILAILNRGTQNLTFTTDRRQTKAIATNLEQSAKAWITHHKPGGGIIPGLLTLDVNELTTRPATLQIHPQDPNQAPTLLTIETQCTYGKHQNRQTHTISPQ